MVFTISQAPARECPLHFRSIVYLVSNLINNSPSPSSRAHYYLVLQPSVCVKKSRRSITRRPTVTGKCCKSAQSQRARRPKYCVAREWAGKYVLSCGQGYTDIYRI